MRIEPSEILVVMFEAQVVVFNMSVAPAVWPM